MMFSGYRCDNCHEIVEVKDRSHTGNWLTTYEQHESKLGADVPLDFCGWPCLLAYGRKQITKQLRAEAQAEAEARPATVELHMDSKAIAQAMRNSNEALGQYYTRNHSQPEESAMVAPDEELPF